LQFPTPFSDRRYLSRSNREIRNFDVFGPPIFLGKGPQIFDLVLKITVTTEHVAKFGDERLPRLDGVKSMIETTAAFYNGGRPAGGRP